jgi:hypothetical protein
MLNQFVFVVMADDAFTTQRSWTDLQFRSANFLMELNQVLNSTFQPSQWPILDITNVNDVFLCEEAVRFVLIFTCVVFATFFNRLCVLLLCCISMVHCIRHFPR